MLVSFIFANLQFYASVQSGLDTLAFKRRQTYGEANSLSNMVRNDQSV